MNFEANDLEYIEMQELMIESVKETVKTEGLQASQAELRQLAANIELAFGGAEEELIGSLRFTAEMNPISETAYDLREEALEVLR